MWISSGSYRSDMITYIVHEVHLLTGDVGAISKGKRGIWCKSCYVTQPDLKEANLDEDQLIILTQVTETWKERSFAFTVMFALVSWNGKHFLSIFQHYKLDSGRGTNCPTQKDRAMRCQIFFLELMAGFRISCHHFKEEGNISLPAMHVFKWSILAGGQKMTVKPRFSS